MTARVGVIGGGQLARMMIPPAIEMGIDLRVLAETEDSSASFAASMVGDYRDHETVLAFSKEVDVVTFDHEHVPGPILQALEESGVAVRPGSSALESAQDKVTMRQRLATLGVPIPRWAVATSPEEIDDFLGEPGNQAIAKTPRGGYDGKGVRVISSSKDVDDWLSLGPVLLEEKVEFVREVAQLVARRPSGEVAPWPVVETVQKNGVCAEVIAPAPVSKDLHDRAQAIAITIAEGLDVTGVLAVEMFVLADGSLLVNELAMRPHNSGHIFTELSRTSQFEQHLRAVLDLPLGDTSLSAPNGVMVNIFGGVERDKLAETLGTNSIVKVHDYGKSARAGRKAGHVSAVGEDTEVLLVITRRAAEIVSVDPR